MKFEEILEYQKLDSEMFKLEKEMRENPNKQMANMMYENMKKDQTYSHKLEGKAGQLLEEFAKIKKQLTTQEDKRKEFMARDLSTMSEEEVKNLKTLNNKLSQNLQILEKNLAALAESTNQILAEFNKTIKNFNAAKEKYTASKAAYDEDAKAIEKKKSEISSQLENMASQIQPELMQLYLKRRKENVFPVVVKLNGNSCGGCHVELPYAQLSKLNEDGVLSCEHCRRIIFK